MEERRKAEEQKRLRKSIYLDKIIANMPEALSSIETSFIKSSIKIAQDCEKEAKQFALNNIKKGIIGISSHSTPIKNIVISMTADAKKHEIKDNLRQLHFQKNIIDSDEYNYRINQLERTFKNSPTNLEEVSNQEMSLKLIESSSTGKIKQVSFRSKSEEETMSDYKLLLAKIKREKKQRAKLRQEQILKEELRYK